MVQPEYRIYEMNKRLQTRTEVSPTPRVASRCGIGVLGQPGLEEGVAGLAWAQKAVSQEEMCM